MTEEPSSSLNVENNVENLSVENLNVENSHHEGQHESRRDRPYESSSDVPDRGEIAERDRPFLEKVMQLGDISDPFDARDLTEVVYRVMRDEMTTEASDRVAEELHKEILPTDNKALQMEISDLWKDTNPLVGFLSRVRPPWHGPGVFNIDSDRFIFRVANEGGMPPTTNGEKVVKAVFSATKDELSEERIQEIASWLPDYVRGLWEKA